MLFKTLFVLAAGAASVLAQEAQPAANQWKNNNHHDTTAVHAKESMECASHQKSYCCTQTVAPDAPGIGILGSILDNLFLGIECVPINLNVLAADSTSQCSANVMCCSGSEMDGGKMVLGCDAPTKKNQFTKKTSL
ncbi:hypothetical protein CXG81DRAFT_24522 [Caulochytrium protostelioides]|uniref:Hydrophobin n=1 Tax=Caulochytrium protostelioides TaxID=1555241 RepID=A0A4P9WX93_9FUNG|nr:hypothetical protein CAUPRSCDRAFT_10369 [Caulochytrium protostelioides]RKP02823.1 hypothetical protein CXG81DRAFT_24522 [Caulochytrium protostelioides]|eukprot:RKP02823.1 hypothetical protein CXG81DRAFT_24522 [Caulochytrium protostelioides]